MPTSAHLSLLACLAANLLTAQILPVTLDFGADPWVPPSPLNSGGRDATVWSDGPGADGQPGRLDGVTFGQTPGIALTQSIGTLPLGESVRLGLSFYTRDVTSHASTLSVAGLVLSAQSTNTVNNDNSNLEILLRTDTSALSGVYGFRLRSHDAAGTRTQVFLPDTIVKGAASPLTGGTWFDFSAEITRTTADSYAVSLALGPAGSAPFLLSSTSVTNNALGGNLYAGLLWGYSGNDVAALSVDNFSVVPEPAHFAALFGLIALFFARRRSGTRARVGA